MNLKNTTNFVASMVCLMILVACKETTSKPNKPSENPISIVIHGGAGTILKENMNDSLENAYHQKLNEAVSKGYQMLQQGASSLDVVEEVVKILEDSPLFNAGKGAVLTNQDTIELDAAIMDGKNQNAGAVAGITTIKNPISLARKVMEESEHVMMIGSGAETFAKLHQLEQVDPSYFFTKSRKEALQKAKEKEANSNPNKDEKFGTVGCVALDNHGNIAAGTSTGGMTNKKFGRVGDVPIIGAGTYAKNQVCGVSATGWGEFFIRNVVAYDIAAQMTYQNKSLADAAKETIHQKVAKMGGDGGIIALDSHGNVVMEFNTKGMYRASIDANGKKKIAIYQE